MIGAVLKRRGYIRGFTLIELSIVLVVIGLIVGGILVGQSVIQAAEVRAQITQIEKYNSAVNTFRSKYNYTPGDIIGSAALQFGFAARGLYGGEGDGNGVIEANACNCVGGGAVNAVIQGAGETAMFWVDLSAAQLIDGTFNTANASTLASNDVPATGVGNYLPAAKIGNSNYVFAYSWNAGNYFGLSQVNGIYSHSATGILASAPVLTVRQAFSIDAKLDDGLPTSGNVTVKYITGGVLNSPSLGVDNATTCFNSVTGTYSVTYNNGSGGKCALSFKMQ